MRTHRRERTWAKCEKNGDVAWARLLSVLKVNCNEESNQGECLEGARAADLERMVVVVGG